MKTPESSEAIPTTIEVTNALTRGREESMLTAENETYIRWVTQREMVADSDQSGKERLILSLDTVEVLYNGGYVDEAFDALQDVGSILGGQGFDDLEERYRRLEDLFCED